MKLKLSELNYNINHKFFVFVKTNPMSMNETKDGRSFMQITKYHVQDRDQMFVGFGNVINSSKVFFRRQSINTLIQ